MTVKHTLFSGTARGAVRSAMALPRKDENGDHGAEPSLLDTAPEAKVEDAPKVEDQPKVEDASKVEDQPKVEDPPKTEEEPKVEGAPETYAEFKAPEGMELDTKLIEEFLPDFKERGLTQEQAQAEVDRAAKLAEKWSTRAVEAFTETTKEWRESIKADPEFGGEKLGQTVALAKRVVDTFGNGDTDLKEIIDQFRLGDHPGFIRLLARVGAAVSEDVFVAGGKARAAPSITETLYPTMNKKD